MEEEAEEGEMEAYEGEGIKERGLFIANVVINNNDLICLVHKFKEKKKKSVTNFQLRKKKASNSNFIKAQLFNKLIINYNKIATSNYRYKIKIAINLLNV